MLSPEEFTVGTFKTAAPGSLILPRTTHEAVSLICEGGEEPTAVVLRGDYLFHSFRSVPAENWRGVIIPNVRVEVDEASLFDPDYDGHALGVVVRQETSLVVLTRGERYFGRPFPVVIQSGLPEAKGSAAFKRWQLVLGQGDRKRVLHEVNLSDHAHV